MTFPLLRAHKAQTAALLEGLNQTLPGRSPDVADLKREIAFRNTLAQTQTALLLIELHPDEPAPEMAALARYAIAQTTTRSRDPDVEQPPLPADTDLDELITDYRRVLKVLLEVANTARRWKTETFDDILRQAGLHKHYMGPLGALSVVKRCELLPGSTIARFAHEARVDYMLPLAGPNGRAPSTGRD